MSARLFEEYEAGKDAVYTWDWGENGRAGSWRPGGKNTSINRYFIDFESRIQRNMDNGRMRSIRVVHVRPQDIVPQVTGQWSADKQWRIDGDDL